MMLYNFVTVLLVVLSFENCIAEDSIDSLMKKTVDFDAPVIDSVKVLEMLKQLQQLIPKDNSAIHYDLENLIDFATMKFERCTGYNELDKYSYYMKRPNTLSSPARNKLFGANILAFFRYFKQELVRYCRKELESNVAQLDSSDLIELRKLVSATKIKEIGSCEDFNNINKGQIFAGVVDYIKRVDPGLDKLMQKAKQRSTIAKDRYQKLVPDLCARMSTKMKPTAFLVAGLLDKEAAPAVLESSFLKEWTINSTVCGTILGADDKDFDYFYFDGKVPAEKVPFWRRATGRYGGSGGYSGGPSISHMTMSNA